MEQFALESYSPGTGIFLTKAMTVVDSQSFDIPTNEVMISACCNDNTQLLYTVTHDRQNYEAIIREWYLDGTCNIVDQTNFKKFGVLQNIFL